MFDVSPEARLVQSGASYKVGVSIHGCHPPLKHHAAWASYGGQIAVPRRLRGVAGHRTVRAVITDELLELGEQGHLRHSLPLRPARVHGVGEGAALTRWQVRTRGPKAECSGFRSAGGIGKRLQQPSPALAHPYDRA